jgi:sec-independent protein translocase protein TatB
VFNFQGSELVIILLLALVVLGPEKLPDAMRKAGQFYAELKKMSSGFQQEFRSAIDEPMREIRDTANLLRDSADFTKLQSGERQEKPKSADMIAPADPDAVPAETVPFDSTPPAGQADAAVDGEVPPRPEPFSSIQFSSASPRTPAVAPASPSAVPTPPPPFAASDALPSTEPPRSTEPPAATEPLSATGAFETLEAPDGRTGATALTESRATGADPVSGDERGDRAAATDPTDSTAATGPHESEERSE